MIVINPRDVAVMMDNMADDMAPNDRLITALEALYSVSSLVFDELDKME